MTDGEYKPEDYKVGMEFTAVVVPNTTANKDYIALDKRKYDESRGFCYPLEETPFPVAQTEGELAAAIRSFDFGKYAADRAAFLAARGCMEDGHAAERAAGLVADIVRGDWS